MNSELKIRSDLDVLVRAASPEVDDLLDLAFRRYPDDESGSFAWFGWRETPGGIVLTLASIETPRSGDLDDTVPNICFLPPSIRRAVKAAQEGRLAAAVVHSHPAECHTGASIIDDDMDTYFADLFAGYTPDRPYVSLIFAHNASGQLSGTGRIFWRGEWHAVRRFAVERKSVYLEGYSSSVRLSAHAAERIARLRSAFGEESASRLAGATVAVIGASGTGSPAIEALARAGVGHLIIVDPDVFAASNLERVHGSWDADVGTAIPKAEIARRHIQAINPDCQVTAILGALPQPEVIDAVATANVVLGCTDQHYSRVALSDLAVRYLVPVIDCGVQLEGGGGNVTAQVVQLVRLLPADPCVYCQDMVSNQRVQQELMSPAERAQRMTAAEQAAERGEAGDAYWQELPQLNTVGYLTTTAGAMAAGYAIGWITGRFDPPFLRLQMDLGAPLFGVVDARKQPRAECACRRARGTADQGGVDAFIWPAAHWSPAVIL